VSLVGNSAVGNDSGAWRRLPIMVVPSAREEHRQKKLQTRADDRPFHGAPQHHVVTEGILLSKSGNQLTTTGCLLGTRFCPRNGHGLDPEYLFQARPEVAICGMTTAWNARFQQQ
jgi:hypothetical protein